MTAVLPGEERRVGDIFQEIEEDLRRDRLDRLWKRYGPYLIAVFVLIVAGTAGYVGWREYSARQQFAYSDRYEEAVRLAAEGKEGQAAEILAALASDAEGGYAVVARLREAELRAKTGDTAAATRLFDAVAADGSVDKLYRDLATLLSVMHQVESGDPKALAARLEPLTADAGPWRYTAREISALLAMRAGDTQQAREQYAKLADDPKAPQGLRARAAEMVRALQS